MAGKIGKNRRGSQDRLEGIRSLMDPERGYERQRFRDRYEDRSERARSGQGEDGDSLRGPARKSKRMSAQWAGSFVLVLSFSLASLGACQRQSNPEGAMTTAPVSVSDQKTQKAKEGGDYSFGIPNCDAFVKKYEDCVKNVASGEEREKYRVHFEKTIEELGKAQAGAMPYGVEEACSRREQEAKSLLVAQTCQW